MLSTLKERTQIGIELDLAPDHCLRKEAMGQRVEGVGRKPGQWSM